MPESSLETRAAGAAGRSELGKKIARRGVSKAPRLLTLVRYMFGTVRIPYGTIRNPDRPASRDATARPTQRRRRARPARGRGIACEIPTERHVHAACCTHTLCVRAPSSRPSLYYKPRVPLSPEYHGRLHFRKIATDLGGCHVYYKPRPTVSRVSRPPPLSQDRNRFGGLPCICMAVVHLCPHPQHRSTAALWPSL